MKTLIILLAVGLVVAAPGEFYHHHQYHRTAETYKNNELQHKSLDAGYYAKQGDTDSNAPPKEKHNYIHREYNKPKNDDEEHIPFSNFGQRRYGYDRKPYFMRPWNSYRNKHVEQPKLVDQGLVEIDDQKNIFESHVEPPRYQTGSGREYLENTEGGNVKPVYEENLEKNKEKDILDLTESDNSDNKDDTQQTHKVFEHDFGQQKEEDLSQVSQSAFDFGQQKEEDLSQVSQSGFDFGGQQKEEDLTQVSQSGLDFGGQQKEEDLSQVSQSAFDFGGQQKEEDLTQVSQSGFDIGGHQQEDLSQKVNTNHNYDDLSHYSTIDYNTREQQKEDSFYSQQHKNDKLDMEELEHILQKANEEQQKQDVFSVNNEKTDLAQDNFEKKSEDELHITTIDYNYGNLQKEDVSEFEKMGNVNINFDGQKDLSQKDLVTDYEMGGQQKEDISHLSTGNSYGGQQQEDLSQKDLTMDYTMGGQKDLVMDYTMGGQQKVDLSQKDLAVDYDLGGQQKEDLSQKDLGFDYNLGGQQKEDLSQKDLGFDYNLGGQQKEDISHLSPQYNEQQQEDLSKKFESVYGNGRQYGDLSKSSHDYDDLKQSQSGFDDYKYDKAEKDSGYYQSPVGESEKQLEYEIKDLEQQMKAIDEVEQYAKKLNKNYDEQQPEHDYGKSEIEHVETTKKPGFWGRLGSSISKTYEKAKEKTKELGKQIKEKLGKK